MNSNCLYSFKRFLWLLNLIFSCIVRCGNLTQLAHCRYLTYWFSGVIFSRFFKMYHKFFVFVLAEVRLDQVSCTVQQGFPPVHCIASLALHYRPFSWLGCSQQSVSTWSFEAHSRCVWLPESWACIVRCSLSSRQGWADGSEPSPTHHSGDRQDGCPDQI